MCWRREPVEKGDVGDGYTTDRVALFAFSFETLNMAAHEHAGNRANESCDSCEDLAIPRMQESKMCNLETG
jgi:hypothetical protein